MPRWLIPRKRAVARLHALVMVRRQHPPAVAGAVLQRAARLGDPTLASGPLERDGWSITLGYVMLV